MRSKRIITLLLVLSFAFTMLSACGNANDEQTNDADNNEYKLEMPSKELQERFVEEYIAYHNYDPNNPPTVTIEYWFGSFGDIALLFASDSDLSYGNVNWIFNETNNKFDYPPLGLIQVWIDEEFLFMYEAIKFGLITDDMLSQIRKVHEQQQAIKVY